MNDSSIEFIRQKCEENHLCMLGVDVIFWNIFDPWLVDSEPSETEGWWQKLTWNQATWKQTWLFLRLSASASNKETVLLSEWYHQRKDTSFPERKHWLSTLHGLHLHQTFELTNIWIQKAWLINHIYLINFFSIF